jgi:hypothetical protein
MFFDPDAIETCVERGIRERLPEPGAINAGHFDASGGRHDNWALAIGHRAGDSAVLDVLRVWRAQVSPANVIGEAASLLKQYGCYSVTGDRYAAQFVVDAFATNGITYQASARDQSAIYLDTLPLVNAGRVVFLDKPDLLRELRGLERRRGSSGRDRVDHLPGAFDDQALVAAGVLSRLASGAAFQYAGEPLVGFANPDSDGAGELSSAGPTAAGWREGSAASAWSTHVRRRDVDDDELEDDDPDPSRRGTTRFVY